MTLECDVCGGQEFELIDGYQVCALCCTQSQVDREKDLGLENQLGLDSTQLCSTAQVKEIKLARGSAKKTPGTVKPRVQPYGGRVRKPLPPDVPFVPWTNYEGFQLVLDAQCHALIKLGYPRSIRQPVLQLWFKYVERRTCGERASPSSKRRSARLRDTPVASAKAQQRRRAAPPEAASTAAEAKPIKCESNSPVAAQVKSEAEVKTELVRPQSRTTHGRPGSDGSSDERDGCLSSPPRAKGRFKQVSESTSARRSSVSSGSASDWARRRRKAAKMSRGCGAATQLIGGVRRGARGTRWAFGLNPFAVPTVEPQLALTLCVLVLALSQSGVAVCFSELLRLARAGQLPLCNVLELFPACWHVGQPDARVFSLPVYNLPSVQKLARLMQKLCKYLQLRPIFPLPLELFVAITTCRLNLPHQVFVLSVHRLRRWLHPASGRRTVAGVLNHTGRHQFYLAFMPDVVAVVVVLLVLLELFRLDSCSEHLLSAAARQLRADGARRPFVYNDWQDWLYAAVPALAGPLPLLPRWCVHARSGVADSLHLARRFQTRQMLWTKSADNQLLDSLQRLFADVHLSLQANAGCCERGANERESAAVSMLEQDLSFLWTDAEALSSRAQELLVLARRQRQPLAVATLESFARGGGTPSYRLLVEHAALLVGEAPAELHRRLLGFVKAIGRPARRPARAGRSDFKLVLGVCCLPVTRCAPSAALPYTP